MTVKAIGLARAVHKKFTIKTIDLSNKICYTIFRKKKGNKKMKLIIVISVLGFWTLMRTIRNMKKANDNIFIGYSFQNLPDFLFYPIVFICELAKAIILPSLVFLIIYLHWFC